MASKPKFVFLSSALPTVPRSGAAMRDEGILSLVPPHMETEIIYVSNSAEILARPGQVVVRSRRPWLVRAATAWRPYVANGFCPLVADRIRRAYRPGATLWVSRLALAQYIPFAAELGYRTVLDEHNVESDFYLTAVRSTGKWLEWPRAKLLAHWERKFCATAHEVVATSAADAAAIAKLSRRPARVIPNCVDVPESPSPAGEEILFVGALDYAPNAEGILWFAEMVWPLVATPRPLRVVGARPAASLVEKLRGLGAQVHANAPELDTHYAAAALCVAPLLNGGGTRIKILEALARGKALVSTGKGAEGLALREGIELVIADEPGRMAAEISALLLDPASARRMGEAGRRQVADRYSWPGQAAAFNGLLASPAPV